MLDPVRAVAQPITNRANTVLDRHTPNQQSRASDPDRPLRVLVVDDNPDAADALAEVAEWLGCKTRTAYSGAEALDLLREELPDVLLLDLTMPEVDGLEVAAHARRLAMRRPILLVATTALGSWEDRTATALAGFHFHMLKPIDTPTLRTALDRFRALYYPAPVRGDAASEAAG